MPKTTIRDVATLAGVSVGTASMAINNSPHISTQTKEQVLQAVAQLEYRRNPYARSFSLSSSKTIGFLLPDLLNPFFGELAGCLQKEVEERGNTLMLGLSNETALQEARLIQQFFDRGVDGLILVPVVENSPNLDHIKQLVKTNFPFVSISSYYKGFEKNCVMTDLYRGSYELTLTLFDMGHRNIILISGNPDLVPFQERLRGFTDAHKKSNIPLSKKHLITAESMSFQGGYDAIRPVYYSLKPDAIIAINDVMAMGIIGSLHACGVRVPQDVSVAGYDNISISGLQETPLSTVQQPIAQMCQCAVEMLFNIIKNGKEVTQPVYLQPDIILRKSTAYK